MEAETRKPFLKVKPSKQSRLPFQIKSEKDLVNTSVHICAGEYLKGFLQLGLEVTTDTGGVVGVCLTGRGVIEGSPEPAWWRDRFPPPGKHQSAWCALSTR